MNRFGEILRSGWRGAKHRAGAVLAGAAVIVVSFLVGLHLFFPLAAAQQWLTREVEARTSIRMQIGTLSLKPFFTLSARDVVMTFGDGGLAPIAIDELRLKPLWSSLISDNPGVSVAGTLLGGRFDAAVQRNGDVDLRAGGVRLAGFPVNQAAQTLLSGHLAKIEWRRSFPAKKPGENRLAAEIDNCLLQIMGQPLTLGKITLDGSGQGNSLRIAMLTASGGDLAISGSGALLLGATPAVSRVSLDLTLRPVATATPNLAALLDLAARRQGDGSYRLRLNGSLTQLTIEPTTVPVAVPPPGSAPPDEPSEEE